MVLGFFNRGDTPHTVTIKLDRLGLPQPAAFRDVWRQKDAGTFEKETDITVQPHNVMLYKVTAAPATAPAPAGP